MIDKRVLQLVVKRRVVSTSFNCSGRVADQGRPFRRLSKVESLSQIE